jgi:hypothetical protein
VDKFADFSIIRSKLDIVGGVSMSDKVDVICLCVYFFFFIIDALYS